MAQLSQTQAHVSVDQSQLLSVKVELAQQRHSGQSIGPQVMRRQYLRADPNKSRGGAAELDRDRCRRTARSRSRSRSRSATTGPLRPVAMSGLSGQQAQLEAVPRGCIDVITKLQDAALIVESGTLHG